MTAYLSLAFGLAWLPCAVVLAGGSTATLALMPIAPAIGCLVVRRWVTREGFSDLGLRLSWRQLRHRWPIWLVALTWPLAASPLATTMRTHSLKPTIPSHVCWWLALSVAAAPLILGEELGWRGYLQGRLCPRRPLGAAVATGLLWGVWHYPLLLIAGDPRPAKLAEFTVGTVIMSVFLGWLHTRGGSIWFPSVGHASNNVTEDNLARVGVGSGSAHLVSEAVVCLGIALVATCRPTRRVERFPHMMNKLRR